MFFYGNSDIGRKRTTNQDKFLAAALTDDITLGVVCDGMGGARGGNIASQLAIDVFEEKIREYIGELLTKKGSLEAVTEGDLTALLARAVVKANHAVYRRASSDEALKGMGTTLVAALLVKENLYVVNIGDSRLYLLAGGEMAQITRDHSLVQHLIDSGQISVSEAADYPSKNVITRAVGIDMNIEADIFSVDLSLAGEGCILLCSDGLTNFVTKNAIQTIIEEETPQTGIDQKTTKKIVDELISRANANGGNDNITAVMIAYGA